MLAAHFDNWVFLLLVAVAMLFRWLSTAAGKANKDSDESPRRSTSTPPPVPRAPADSDADRIRKFLEALGQPPESEPPPPILHRTDIPPRSLAPVRPPASTLPLPPKLRTRKVVVPEQPAASPGEWLQEAKVMAPVELVTQPAPEFSAKTKSVPIPVEAYTIPTLASSTAAKIDIVSLLGSAKGLREAIILREIFGPPRSLQSLDLIGTA